MEAFRARPSSPSPGGRIGRRRRRRPTTGPGKGHAIYRRIRQARAASVMHVSPAGPTPRCMNDQQEDSDPVDGAGVARAPHAGAVPHPSREGHRTGLQRGVLGRPPAGHVPLCGLRGRALRVGHQVRLRQWLAELLRAGAVGGDRDEDRSDRPSWKAHGGDVRGLRSATWATSSRTAHNLPGSATASTRRLSAWTRPGQRSTSSHPRSRGRAGAPARLVANTPMRCLSTTVRLIARVSACSSSCATRVS